MAFGKLLKQVLKDKNKTVTWLSHETKIPASTLYSIISRDTIPNKATIIAIAAALNMDIKSFLRQMELENDISIDIEKEYASMYNFLGKIVKDSISKSDYIEEDDELTEYLDELHNRPEMKMLFKVAKKATKEDVEKAVKIIEMFKKDSSNEDDI